MTGRFKEFENYLKLELNRSSHTSEAYIRDINQFATWLTGGSTETFDYASVTTQDIRAWLGSIAHANAPASIRRKTQSLRAYFHWLLKNGKIKANPASDIILAKTPRRLPEYIKDEEIEKLLTILDTEDDYKTQRARFILLMLYATGLRQEELRQLTDDDIDFSLQEAKVTGKRNKQRIVPLAKEMIEEIRKWQKTRNSKYPGLNKSAPLIPGINGKISKGNLYKQVHDSLSGIPASHKSPHLLRHTFATAMLRNGASLDAVKEFLGHASLSTTQIYTHLSFSELQASYRSAHPRSKQNHDIQADEV